MFGVGISANAKLPRVCHSHFFSSIEDFGSASLHQEGRDGALGVDVSNDLELGAYIDFLSDELDQKSEREEKERDEQHTLSEVSSKHLKER